MAAISGIYGTHRQGLKATRQILPSPVAVTLLYTMKKKANLAWYTVRVRSEALSKVKVGMLIVTNRRWQE